MGPSQNTESSPGFSEEDHVIAKNFMQKAQTVLAKPDYQSFHRLLLEYKQEKIATQELFDQICLLLNKPDTLDLPQNFKTFLPEEHKEPYSAFIQEKLQNQ